MEVPLTPLEFARRARALYADREARRRRRRCGSPTRSSSTAATAGRRRCSALGVRPGDRVAYIAPNTHAQLESFYAVPQIGAVLVPINYRLTADDFAYIINHCGATVVCAHADYLERRRQHPAGAARRRALRRARRRDARRAGSTTRRSLADAAADVRAAPAIAENDLLTINYTSGTTSRPKGVMITHRNAYMNVVGTLVHLPMTMADRYLWTLPMFHANGWTFVWIVTAVGATHVCLRKVEPAQVFEPIDARVDHDALRRADGADRHRQRAGRGPRGARRAACASSPPARRRRRRPSSASRASSAGRSRRSTA